VRRNSSSNSALWRRTTDVAKQICDLRGTAMKQKQQDPHVWTKVKIDLLREIAQLEKLLTR
jgi:hypothetical protein